MSPIDRVLVEWRQMKYYFLLIAASLNAAKRKLTEVEALEATAGSSLPHKLHPSSFVRMGLDVEDQQYGVRPIAHIRLLTHLI